MGGGKVGGCTNCPYSEDITSLCTEIMMDDRVWQINGGWIDKNSLNFVCTYICVCGTAVCVGVVYV